MCIRDREKGGEISRNVDELLATFEAEYANSAVHASQIMEILQECYTSPDFSISVLADKFEVSIAYMSYLFKKKFDKNFSDYLWELRLAKAKDMLLNTSMPDVYKRQVLAPSSSAASCRLEGMLFTK